MAGVIERNESVAAEPSYEPSYAGVVGETTNPSTGGVTTERTLGHSIEDAPMSNDYRPLTRLQPFENAVDDRLDPHHDLLGGLAASPERHFFSTGEGFEVGTVAVEEFGGRQAIPSPEVDLHQVDLDHRISEDRRGLSRPLQRRAQDQIELLPSEPSCQCRDLAFSDGIDLALGPPLPDPDRIGVGAGVSDEPDLGAF
jgi:hypothetical protein